jgi:hypothetical protein
MADAVHVNDTSASVNESVVLDNTTPTEAPAAPQAPSIPDKFKNKDGSLNTEALLKSYSELEKKGVKVAPKEDTVPKDLKVSKEVKPKEVLGDDLYTRIEAQYAESGTLSDELYTELASKGFSRKMTDAFIEGQKVVASKYEADVTAEVGGIEAYRTMQEWAAKGLQPEEIDMINEAVTSGSPAKARMAVGFLKSRYLESEGNPPSLVEGNAPSAGIGFESRDEYVEAISDKRYGKESAYTKSVEAKLAASTYYLRK